MSLVNMSQLIHEVPSALLVVDYQNDFLAGGALPIKGANDILPTINGLTMAFTMNRIPSFFSRDWHPVDSTHFNVFGGKWPVHCVANTTGAEFPSGLIIPFPQSVLNKGMDPKDEGLSAVRCTCISGCHKVVDVWRDMMEIKRLFVAGLATDVCVKATVLDALTEGFEVYVFDEACAAVNIEPHDGGLAMMAMKDAGARIIVDITAGILAD